MHNCIYIAYRLIKQIESEGALIPAQKIFARTFSLGPH